MTAGYLWLTAMVFLLILEAVIPGTFFMASLAVGTFFAAGAAFLAPQLAWVQWLTFCVAGTLSVVLTRRLVAHLDKSPTVPMNVDAIIGRKGVVTQTIESAGNCGRVRVDADEWRATAERDIAEGEQVEVREVRGTRLIVA